MTETRLAERRLFFLGGFLAFQISAVSMLIIPKLLLTTPSLFIGFVYTALDHLFLLTTFL